MTIVLCAFLYIANFNNLILTNIINCKYKVRLVCVLLTLPHRQQSAYAHLKH